MVEVIDTVKKCFPGFFLKKKVKLYYRKFTPVLTTIILFTYLYRPLT